MAVQLLGRAIIGHEETLCPKDKGAAALSGLKDLLQRFMPEATVKDIDYSASHKGAATDDIPQDRAEDIFLDAKGTPPGS